MAQQQSNLISWSQYLPLRALAVLIGCVPIDINMQSSKVIGDLFFRLSKKRRHRAIENISTSFPELTHEEARALARKSMEHLFQLFVAEGVQMPSLITPTSWHKYIEFKNVEQITARLTQNKPTIFITGHCGNWELLGYALSVLGYPIAALARPLDNPLINNWVLSIRERFGLQIVTKFGGVSVLQELIKQNKSVGFIADQNAGDRGMFVPFFGRLASTYKSIGLLAMKYELPIAAVHAKRIDGRFKYEISVTDFIEPDDWNNQPDPLYYITARYNKAIEQMVINAPEQYLWLHRRWKSRPKFETNNLPMPKKLIQQIESLPWMTNQEVANLTECYNLS
ncbi:MAG: lysophospholipid acyltransferase family protein [Phycisphaerales bacterium]|nr:lysophospholipid acyltransferase family protein [Planctomycetota bacterium]MBL6996930.1 lysophospholipid acyltransferase family protein [Phycisphaerales bacterium]